jgi:L-ribulose-5-phosphate 3-epimerase
MTASLLDRPFGVYEKALGGGSWPAILSDARRAGFDFVEMSIDESEARLARLEWSRRERRQLVGSCQEQDMPIFSICLSAHRKFGLGSNDPSSRARAGQILDAAMALACDLGVRVVQIAGYFAYYETRDPEARARYVAGLRRGAELAQRRGVMLAVENIDTPDMASLSECLALRDEVGSPWFALYPDLGNLAVHRLDILAELELLPGVAVALHLKDARPGEPRRVPFGQGTVPFRAVFEHLAQSDFSAPFTVEMWNDDPTAAVQTAARALGWIKDQIRSATPVIA